jgi:hypothetical protein
LTQYNIVSGASLVAGQPEDVSIILANLQAIASVLNGNLDNANLHASAAIAKSKLAALDIMNSDVNGAAAIAVSKLAAGTEGQSLDTVAGVPAWTTPVPSGLTLISEQLLAAPAASVTFSAIPQTYRSIEVRALAKSDAAVHATLLLLDFNGDAGAVYSYQWNSGYGAFGMRGVATLDQVRAELGDVSAATQTYPSAIYLLIPGYAGTVLMKAWTGHVGGAQSEGSPGGFAVGGGFKRTTAITSLRLRPNAGNFIIGSRFALYGVL